MVTFYWIRTGLSGGSEKREGKKKKKQRGEKSLSTCSKTQCVALKTVKKGIFLKWAKSRLRCLRQRDERREGGEEIGVEEASPGELRVIDRIPTRQDALKKLTDSGFVPR